MQRLVQAVELLARGRGYAERKPHIVATSTRAHFDGRGIERGIELQHDVGECLGKVRVRTPHDLDREFTGVLDEGFFRRNFRKHSQACSRVRIASSYPLRKV